MKKIVLFLLASALIISCKKDDEAQILKDRLSGTWEFENHIGPFFVRTLPPGNGEIIFLGADGTFERRSHDTVEFKGAYTLRKIKDCYERENNLTLSTSESSSNSYDYIEIESGKLRLSTPNCYQDGGITIYRRIQ